jgi:hypothetical protein
VSRNLFGELRRRNVFRMAGLYAVAAWLIVQVSGTVLPMFDAPQWLPRSIVILLVHAQRKQADETFRWLEHGLDTHDAGVTELYGLPYLSAFCEDPRFSALARKIGLPPLPAGGEGPEAGSPKPAKT